MSPPAAFPDFFEAVAARTQEHRHAFESEDVLSPFVDVGAEVTAPWLVPRDPDRDADAVATEVLVRGLGDLEEHPATQLPGATRRGRFTPAASAGTDAIAVYRPWHFFYDDWGIYVFELDFIDFVEDISDLAALPARLIAPLAFRQILWHEWTHFAFEVTATELESVTGVPCYREYSLRRYATRTRWASGPLEEAVAVWREVAFSRGALPRRMRPKPRSYVHAVRLLADASPPGYCDWACMKSPGVRRGAVISDLVSVIADSSVVTSRWGETSPSERDQVPVYWVGNPATLAAVGGLPKTAGPPTIRRFEKWAKKKKATIVARGGKGSHHRLVLADGRGQTYATSAGFLLRPEAEKIAALFGLRNSATLYDAVGRMR